MTTHYLPPADTTPSWHVTVATKEGVFIAHFRADDLKEAQCIATEARAANLSHRIRIRPPAGSGFNWA